MAREKKPDGERARDIFRSKILRLLAKRSLNEVEISKSLGLTPPQREELRRLLPQMEVGGEVARIRKDRYVIPEDADLLTGTIHFHASGSARILSEKAGQPDLQIRGKTLSPRCMVIGSSRVSSRTPPRRPS